MPDTNRRRRSRHLRLLVRATRQIPISASSPLGHAEDLGEVARAHIRVFTATVDDRLYIPGRGREIFGLYLLQFSVRNCSSIADLVANL